MSCAIAVKTEKKSAKKRWKRRRSMEVFTVAIFWIRMCFGKNMSFYRPNKVGFCRFAANNVPTAQHQPHLKAKSLGGVNRRWKKRGTRKEERGVLGSTHEIKKPA
jgi:hypothetical protein